MKGGGGERGGGRERERERDKKAARKVEQRDNQLCDYQ